MRPRHPEKINNPIYPIKKKPNWIRSKILSTQNYLKTKEIVNKNIYIESYVRNNFIKLNKKYVFSKKLPYWLIYRNEYFDTEDNTLTVYEYKHPLRVSQNNLEMREDKNGVKINVYFEKKYKCEENKELFEGLER